jgi:excinuclease Cho
MPLPRRRRTDFEHSASAEDLQHLRAAIEGVPQAAGVYTFHGEAGDLPLYIGKSVNLRSRLLSHLRNADEARMLRQTRRISHTRTAGEMGALLLEAQLIKQLKPLFNQKLRESRQCCSWQLIGPKPELVYSNDLDFAVAPQLYGLFGSRQAGLQALRDMADQHRLCYGALGLEKLAAGKACFRAAIRQCAGVCRGDETPEQHHQRLLDGLQPWGIEPWPWGGAIAVIERDEELTQVHALNRWSYLGSAATLQEARALQGQPAAFDADVYKILLRPLLSGSAQIVEL